TRGGIGHPYLASTSTTLTAAAQTEGKLFRLVDFFSSLLEAAHLSEVSASAARLGRLPLPDSAPPAGLPDWLVSSRRFVAVECDKICHGLSYDPEFGLIFAWRGFWGATILRAGCTGCGMLNLISNAWIPVLHKDGSRSVIAPWQMADGG
ncbi:MAG: hypothetical protein ACK4S2_13960, partial [Gemmobacter sp.]|uniref:hypothetical protein n=1 Tax=Gemmobacter sp. TaxID=1898957 RepID=UPI00391AEA77